MNTDADPLEAKGELRLPASFPYRDYVPFGYLDNPWHSAVLNRSGVIRTVPPLGFGFWCRRLPWPYGEGPKRNLNYLSLAHPAVAIGDSVFFESEDFSVRGVKLASRYHTKNCTTYDFSFCGVSVSLQWFLVSEHALVCRAVFENGNEEPIPISLHASNVYGFPEQNWWGCNGVVARPCRGGIGMVSKMWAYGDHFAIGGDREADALKATGNRAEWRSWIRGNDLSSNAGAAVGTPNAVYSVASYALTVAAKAREEFVFALARGVNERDAIGRLRNTIASWRETAEARLEEDERFYRQAPLLEGDWSPQWKEGWIYDLETLRMTIRPPMGVFTRPWDGMQIHTPRMVLGETMLDSLALSYADPELAKEVVLGTFEDAPAPNIPCCREDGSVNMVGQSGEECGTAPIWGLPFLTIRQIFARTGDRAWLERLFPRLEEFVEWWIENRSDETGYFFCDNSWESGQDGSKRFLIPMTSEAAEGAQARFVRTVDVEAAMASAMLRLSEFATELGMSERAEHWRREAEGRVQATRGMFVDGWFRDFDARTGSPIILDDYWDVMMLLPVAVGIATEEQIREVQHQFQRFFDNPRHWLEWPSFLYPFCEAGYRAGLRKEISNLLAQTLDRVYGRTCSRSLHWLPKNSFGLPDEYNFRIPGVASEFWPIEPTGLMHTGCEGYGWGATLPALVLRHIIGFREEDESDGFVIAPMLPSTLMRPKRIYGVSNLKHRSARFDLRIEVLNGEELAVRLTPKPGSSPVAREDGAIFEEAAIPNGSAIRLREAGYGR
ncbi:MAG: alpha,alpha-trehalase [Fimbriimonadales bacterium]|nr:alpha,alpha-trehalase [Fimbriimonadales bacterium]